VLRGALVRCWPEAALAERLLGLGTFAVAGVGVDLCAYEAARPLTAGRARVASGLQCARGVQEVPAQSGRFGCAATLVCELAPRVAPWPDHVRHLHQAVFQPVEGFFDVGDGDRGSRRGRRVTSLLLKPAGGLLQLMSRLLQAAAAVCPETVSSHHRHLIPSSAAINTTIIRAALNTARTDLYPGAVTMRPCAQALGPEDVAARQPWGACPHLQSKL
jgi:hypothetical protein